MNFFFLIILLFEVIEYTSAGPRILNGIDANIEEHPHQVLILNKTDGLCGGSIISKYFVLTAAHCVFDLELENLMVNSGTDLVYEEDQRRTSHKVIKKIVHEDFNLKAKKNDIALLKVEKCFKLDKNENKINLFENGENAEPGKIAVITGWGITIKIPPPEKLQIASVPIISKDKCKPFFNNFDDGQICAGDLIYNGKGPCIGDSGGPLTIDGRLAGIISYLGKNCDVQKPSVFTEVAYYRKWIDENIK